MIAQAAGLALLAAMSPTALLVAAVYLGSSRPRQTTLFYLAGAVLMTTVIAVVVLAVLRGAGLNRPEHHGQRDGLRLGLGLVLLGLGAAITLRRRRRPPRREKQERQGLVSRMVASPSPGSALAVGLVVFAPGVTLLAALQVVATARASVQLTILAVAVIIVIDVLLVWLPLVLHLLAPGLTARRLQAFNSWLRANGGLLLAGALIVAGAIMVVDGSYGLIAGT